ncbi:hypothetical protein [Saccharopolyspora flava]|uniref:hypothetical protein n=1 Tax=Saccharopolyspora flava TaxID=95161 RepID=UPI000B807375|nr:hypothetical protein [Saccharopolyspora flava]
MVNRLTFDDDLFLRSERVLGIPVTNQSVWRFDRALDPAELDELARRLSAGRLGRRVVRGAFPGARARWVPSETVPPVAVRSEPVESVLSWADAEAAKPLDPVRGPGWRLACAPTEAGGSVLSLVVSHVVGDGGVHVNAVVEAVRGISAGRPPETPVRWWDDVRDAAGQIRRAGRGVLRAVRAPKGSPLPPGTQTSRTREPVGDDTPALPPFAVLDCDAEAWDAAAAARGGSANTLFIAVLTEILLASGRVSPDAPIKVSLPVSTRGEQDDRSNATTGVSLAVTPADGRVTDLAAIRAASKQAFAAAADETPARLLEPLVQLLPDAVVARTAKNSPVPLCLCSNLGELPREFAAPTGFPATSVMMRSLTGGTSPALLRARGGGLTAWLTRTGGTLTLAMLALDPDHVPDTRTLHTHTENTLATWNIPNRAWEKP